MRYFVIPALLLVSACATPLERPANIRIGSVRALATPADVRIITDRPNPDGHGGNILCAEPSPDVAKALSTLFQISASAKTKAGATGSLGGGGSTAEAVSLLAGRTVSVVALRDGLFRACEAYGNRSLNRNAYSLILSQYGDLLVTLTLGEAAAGAAAIGESRNGAPPQAQRIDVHMPDVEGTTPPAAGASALLPFDTTPLLSFAAADKPIGNAKEVTADKPTTDTSTLSALAASPPSATAADAIVKIVQSFANSEATRHQHAVFTMCVNRYPPDPYSKPPLTFEDAVCSNFLGAEADHTKREAELAAAEIKKRLAEADKIAAEARLLSIQADKAAAAQVALKAKGRGGR